MEHEDEVVVETPPPKTSFSSKLPKIRGPKFLSKKNNKYNAKAAKSFDDQDLTGLELGKYGNGDLTEPDQRENQKGDELNENKQSSMRKFVRRASENMQRTIDRAKLLTEGPPKFDDEGKQIKLTWKEWITAVDRPKMIMLLIGNVVLLGVIIILAAKVASGVNKSPGSATSGVTTIEDIEALLYDGEFLAIFPNGKKVIGDFFGDFFIIHTPNTNGKDNLRFLGGCRNTTLSCLTMGYQQTGFFQAGLCDPNDCADPESLFLNNENLLLAAVELILGDNGLQSMGVSIGTEFFEIGTPTLNQLDPSLGVFFLFNATSTVRLVGVAGYIENGLIMSIGYILKNV